MTADPQRNLSSLESNEFEARAASNNSQVC
jgi:hypothetical protein